MKTVKEIAELTGISARTLHYYDEIGLLRPTCKTQAGYQLYDEKALERLEQILFFREFDLPLREIQAVLDQPALDRNQILQMQRRMLQTKKDRLERLIGRIDGILKGEGEMDFQAFDRTELEELFQAMTGPMPEPLRQSAAAEFGGMEAWKRHYIEALSQPDAQQRCRKVMEWYGGKENYLSAAKAPAGREAAESYARRLDAVLQKLWDRREAGCGSFAVREAVAEYGFVLRQLCQTQEERGPMLALARSWRDERTRAALEEQYGPGAAEFFIQAVEDFYGR